MTRTIGSDSDFFDRLTKLIPGEIVAAYLAIEGMVATQPEIRDQVLTVAAIFLAVLNPLYLYFVQAVTKKSQIIVTSLSFLVWVFALGGPFLASTWYRPVYGSVALVLWTVSVPVLQYKRTP